MRPLLALAPLSLLLACSSPGQAPLEPEPASTTPPKEVVEPEVASDEDEAAGDLCELGEDWSTCDGQQVRIQGRKAEQVMQHPMIAQPEGLSPDNRNTKQGYMDTDTAQLIVLTAEPFDCAGAMTVVGVLRRVDLGGDPGTKDSYSGWSVEDAEVSCE